MKRIALLIIVLFIGANISSDYKFSPKTPRQDLSGISIYNEFILGLRSGVVNKTTIDTGGLYELLDTTQEDIIFNRKSGKLFLSYRSRLPAVPFSYPTPDYYDSNNYYYKVGSDWFYDRFGYYTEKVQAQYLRFPDELLTGCEVSEDVVTQVRDGYSIRLVTKNKGKSTTNVILMKSDHNMIIHNVDIEVTSPYESKKLYKIRYSHVNEDVEVNKPSDLIII